MSPMPGSLVSLAVQEGSEVIVGAEIGVLEGKHPCTLQGQRGQRLSPRGACLVAPPPTGALSFGTNGCLAQGCLSFLTHSSHVSLIRSDENAKCDPCGEEWRY
jgi:hypothetical protein